MPVSYTGQGTHPVLPDQDQTPKPWEDWLYSDLLQLRRLNLTRHLRPVVPSASAVEVRAATRAAVRCSDSGLRLAICGLRRPCTLPGHSMRLDLPVLASSCVKCRSDLCRLHCDTQICSAGLEARSLLEQMRKMNAFKIRYECRVRLLASALTEVTGKQR